MISEKKDLMGLWLDPLKAERPSQGEHHCFEGIGIFLMCMYGIMIAALRLWLLKL